MALALHSEKQRSLAHNSRDAPVAIDDTESKKNFMLQKF